MKKDPGNDIEEIQIEVEPVEPRLQVLLLRSSPFKSKMAATLVLIRAGLSQAFGGENNGEGFKARERGNSRLLPHTSTLIFRSPFLALLPN